MVCCMVKRPRVCCTTSSSHNDIVMRKQQAILASLSTGWRARSQVWRDGGPTRPCTSGLKASGALVLAQRGYSALRLGHRMRGIAHGCVRGRGASRCLNCERVGPVDAWSGRLGGHTQHVPRRFSVTMTRTSPRHHTCRAAVYTTGWACQATQRQSAAMCSAPRRSMAAWPPRFANPRPSCLCLPSHCIARHWRRALGAVTRGLRQTLRIH